MSGAHIMHTRDDGRYQRDSLEVKIMGTSVFRPRPVRLCFAAHGHIYKLHNNLV